MRKYSTYIAYHVGDIWGVNINQGMKLLYSFQTTYEPTELVNFLKEYLP